jgi:hypothetical protein
MTRLRWQKKLRLDATGAARLAKSHGATLGKPEWFGRAPDLIGLILAAAAAGRQLCGSQIEV